MQFLRPELEEHSSKQAGNSKALRADYCRHGSHETTCIQPSLKRCKVLQLTAFEHSRATGPAKASSSNWATMPRQCRHLGSFRQANRVQCSMSGHLTASCSLEAVLLLQCFSTFLAQIWPLPARMEDLARQSRGSGPDSRRLEVRYFVHDTPSSLRVKNCLSTSHSQLL